MVGMDGRDVKRSPSVFVFDLWGKDFRKKIKSEPRFNVIEVDRSPSKRICAQTLEKSRRLPSQANLDKSAGNLTRLLVTVAKRHISLNKTCGYYKPAWETLVFEECRGSLQRVHRSFDEGDDRFLQEEYNRLKKQFCMMFGNVANPDAALNEVNEAFNLGNRILSILMQKQNRK